MFERRGTTAYKARIGAASDAEPVPGTLAFEAACRRLDGRPLAYRVGKRAVDMVFAIAACAVCLIPCIVLAVLVVIDTKGSPLYGQQRVKRGGRPFRIYKFRSMVADADDVEKYFTPEQMEAWRRERKVANDPRITRLGRFMRKTSLDELPQFINVLLGDMSVVGPRAITYDELENFAPAERTVLLSVPQGITGAWQCGPRNFATFENGLRQQLELAYVRHASLRGDMAYFFKTFAVMLVERSGR